VSETTSTSTSTTFSQSVGELTGAPSIPPPPSDAAGVAQAAGNSWRLLLIGLAGLIASLLVLTPARAGNRRR
jgi:hypothetical protein